MADSKFEIIQLGHPHLRRQALAVEQINSPEIQNLLDDLLQFVVSKNGVGIAAPQVDVDLQIFIMCSRPNSRYPEAPDMPPTFVINPEIIWASDEIEQDWEGCLSLPGIRGRVPRNKSIKVRYLSRDGNTIEEQYTGFIARIFQHELDHLQGIVFIDRIKDTHDIMMEQEWLKLRANH